eukprot:TRINITY_DN7134_c0_g2_i1.p1 TRINITY_DN7134_c0_g2~~TRINITY_DN7134_c0_g2_i1.p1  ORF type:complete len:297 (-),score=71.04 TRINITY_DN7134_c0_g2_i1:110-868(-)
MVIYFNMDKREGDTGQLKDWSIFGDLNGDENFNFNGRSYKAFSQYRQGVGNYYYLPSDSNNPLLLDSAYFLGSGKCGQDSDCLSGSTCVNSYCKAGNYVPQASVSSSQQPLPQFIFNDQTTKTPYTWGSQGMNVKINQQDNGAPEGSKDIQIWTNGWGGFGFFTADQTSTDFSAFKTLNFYLKSTATVKVQIQDSNGKSFSSYQASTNNNWQQVSIPLNFFNGVDLTKIHGLFLATMETQGFFAVDDVKYAQ